MTPYLGSLLRERALDDPLALQFLPDERELHALSYEASDPIGDLAYSPVKGIVHRYPDRVLLKVAHSCAVYCRFCFRREMIGSQGDALQGVELDAAIDYVRAHPEVWEVILTGGDPLSLSSRRLADILGRLALIDHVSVLRIHSRVPVVAPDAVDESYVRALTQSKPIYFAVHVNHPAEATEPVVSALRRLSEAGVVLLSQTVLLKGVNDSAAVLEALFRKLVLLKVRPYYLHHPDLARGTSHFRVPIEVGQELMRVLRGRLSGLCLPTYVLDIPGGFGKVPIGPGYLDGKSAGGSREVIDNRGIRHSYPE
ncbi:MAG: lysine-2,3-aminomutase-like protein [Pseudomonadota bacterium]|nr:lysine-2,3-aminomutase-like protein [Pseudomonadota bacterium]